MFGGGENRGSLRGDRVSCFEVCFSRENTHSSQGPDELLEPGVHGIESSCPECETEGQLIKKKKEKKKKRLADSQETNV